MPTTAPRYPPVELAALFLSSLFLSFYQFLTTLHYSASDLQIPPPTTSSTIRNKARYSPLLELFAAESVMPIVEASRDTSLTNPPSRVI